MMQLKTKQQLKGLIKRIEDTLTKAQEIPAQELEQLPIRDGTYSYLAIFRFNEARKALEDAKEALIMVANVE